jgi:hypothetical protein
VQNFPGLAVLQECFVLYCFSRLCHKACNNTADHYHAGSPPIHATDPFGKQEPGLQYLLVYIVLLFEGSGKYSVDYLLQHKSTTARYQQKVKDPNLAIYQ